VTIAYEFTASSYSATEMRDKITLDKDKLIMEPKWPFDSFDFDVWFDVCDYCI
jgi:hypothetical protein